MGNPLFAVVAIVVLIPVLTFVMMEFYIAPKITNIVHEAALGKEAGDGHGGSDHGGDGYGAATDSHGGGGGDGGGYGDGHGMHTYEFNDIVANLMGSLKSRYIKVSFTVESHDPGLETAMTANKAKIVDLTLGILSSLSLNDLDEPGMKNVVRNDIMAGIASVVQSDMISGLYFSEFVVQ